MNDGVTRALLNTGLSTTGQSSAPQIKLLELPAALQKQSVISGEVVKTDHGEITLKTPQGNVVFEADVNVAVGQKVTLKLQVVVQNAQRNLSVELTSVNGQPVKAANPAPTPVTSQPAPLPPTTTQTQGPPPELVEILPVTSQPPQNTTQQPQQTAPVPPLVEDPTAQFPIVQAKVVDLPRVISQESQAILIREILTLPVNRALPPTLQEGLQKIQQLLPLLQQFAPVAPAAALPSDLSEQHIVLSLLQLAQGTSTPAAGNQTALSTWPVQILSLLQTINPGETLDKGVLTALIAQLQAAATPQEEATIPQPPTSPPFTSSSTSSPIAAPLAPSPASSLAPSPPQAPSVPQLPTLQPIPLAALVLGSKETPALPQGTVPTLLLSFQSDSQQSLIFITGLQKSLQQTPLLPGTVLIMNAPLAQHEVAIPMPFSALLNTVQETPVLLPLHPAVGDDWPALQQLWDDILSQQLSIPDAAAALKQTIPMPAVQQMPPAALLFMAALRMGTPESWLGGNILDKLQTAEKIALVSQLARDMQAIRGAVPDGGPSDVWRPLPMPLQVGSDLVRMQWFYRHQYDDLPKGYTPEEETENKKRRKTRFIVDVPQTRLGDIQIDGLMHDRNLDLILRTENTIASHMETAIRGRYTMALETAGIIGGISFQAGRHQYVQV